MQRRVHGSLRQGRGCPGRTEIDRFQRRLTAVADRFDLDMRKIRFELILELKALVEQAQQKVIDAHPAEAEKKQNWTRLAAYVSQVINSIGKTYDEEKTDADLRELEELVEQVKKDKQEETAQP